MRDGFSPLFTGGTGRSGTTVIANLLNRHSQVHTSSPREIRYLCARHGLLDLNFTRVLHQERASTSRRNKAIEFVLRRIGNQELRIFETRIRNSWWQEIGKNGKVRGLVQGISQENFDHIFKLFKQSFEVDRVNASREFFFAMASAQKLNDGIRYFVDSSPLNISNAFYIHQLFPEAKFINMVRDGRETAVSVVKERWGPKTHLEALEWWKVRMINADAALKCIPHVSHITIHLNDFVSLNREGTYQSILNFLELNDEPKMRGYFEDKINSGSSLSRNWRDEVSNVKEFEDSYRKIREELDEIGVSYPKSNL